MAYKMETDTYTCDTCGFEMGWNDNDDVHGEMWGCEKCGDTFCTKCFIDLHGQKEYMRMLQQASVIYCPVCWGKIRKEEAV